MAVAPLPPISPSPSSTAVAPPMSEGARIINTFIAPSKTFTDLRRSAAWWAPFLLFRSRRASVCSWPAPRAGC